MVKKELGKKQSFAREVNNPTLNRSNSLVVFKTFKHKKASLLYIFREKIWVWKKI